MPCPASDTVTADKNDGDFTDVLLQVCDCLRGSEVATFGGRQREQPEEAELPKTNLQVTPDYVVSTFSPLVAAGRPQRHGGMTRVHSACLFMFRRCRGVEFFLQQPGQMVQPNLDFGAKPRGGEEVE
jgi:hypothetical protein